MTVSVVTAPEPRTRPGLMASMVSPDWCAGSPAVEGLYAEVEVDGATFQVSQLAGETDWTVDALFAPGSSCPAWSNGFGARYLRTKVLAPDVARVVTAAAVSSTPTCHGHEMFGHVCTEICTVNTCCQEDPR